ncbi:hypothetical protein NQ318_017666 [Aromia moschata]|uniref:Endonuclease-reverse transcriptase n=1 Tax=Aromia moschata TaxID=1265417 RepID=A0AAV8XQG8_9CUCU|nr:hypothetical protein NQ318_017666 [Aromia moschata]
MPLIERENSIRLARYAQLVALGAVQKWPPLGLMTSELLSAGTNATAPLFRDLTLEMTLILTCYDSTDTGFGFSDSRTIKIYGEVWTLRKEEVQRIEIWERKVLRKIFGGKIQGGRWERRTNREIYDLFKEPNIIGIVRAQRMRWIGHVVRMKDHRIPKMVLIHEIGGGKRLGRPRQRWKKAVEDDIRKAKHWKLEGKS